MARAYIPVYFDLLEESSELTDQEFGRMIRSAIMYARGHENYLGYLQGNERFVFGFLKGQIDRNNAISDARAKAGSSKREQNETNENKTEQKETKKRERKEKKAFTPPTVDEVRAYCRERGNTIDPEAFVAYYENRGWELSKGTKMKDWHLAIVTWEKHNFNKPGTGKTVTAQQYTQRDYTNEQELAMKRMIESMGVV